MKQSNAYHLNEVGTKLSAMNDWFVIALKTADPTTAKAIYRALSYLGPAGLALAALAAQTIGQDTQAKTDADQFAGSWLRPDGTIAVVPDPLPGEGIFAFAIRTSEATGYPANAVGALAQMSSATPFDDWPHIVDYLTDPKRYGVFYTGDVSDAPPFTGQLDPLTLNALDMAAYVRKGLGRIAPQIFSGDAKRLGQWLGRDDQEALKYQAEPWRTELDNYAGPLASFNV